MSTAVRRRHLREIAQAGIAAVSGRTLVTAALADPALARRLSGRRVTLVAAGKVAAPMANAFLDHWDGDLAAAVAAGTAGRVSDGRCEWFHAGHPVPTAESEAAGRRVLALADGTGPDDVLMVLLSGGASACLAVPSAGLALADKVAATTALLHGGVAIDGINCVRKHLSAIKGGRLAVAAHGAVITLAISDVVGPVPDDPAVIGSGPTAGDMTTFADAAAIADAPAVRRAFPDAARRVLERGCRGELPETPAPGDPGLSRAAVRVIGNGTVAVRAAAAAAQALGYTVETIMSPVVGDVRRAAPAHLTTVLGRARTLARPACILSAGETTVEVTGTGRGGRNQEFGLALVEAVAGADVDLVAASVGTDGIDGPTDAAGAIVDRTTLARAAQCGLRPPAAYLAENDSYTYFDRLGDLIRLGPTDTNVGDVQVFLVGRDAG